MLEFNVQAEVSATRYKVFSEVWMRERDYSTRYASRCLYS